jgi:hypothetical protein
MKDSEIVPSGHEELALWFAEAVHEEIEVDVERCHLQQDVRKPASQKLDQRSALTAYLMSG